MKKEYNLKKMKKRPGKVKSDPSATKTAISLRVDSNVLIDLKNEAYRQGLPYQTFISSILYKFVNGELVDKRLADLLKKFKAS